MNAKNVFIGFFAVLALVFSFVLASCDTGTGSDGSGTQEDYKTYIAYDEDGNTFILVVTENSTYVISILNENGTSLGTSTGIVKDFNNTSYTLEHRDGSRFNIDIHFDIIVSIDSSIPLDNGMVRLPKGKLSPTKPSPENPVFVTVIGITGVPTTAEVGTLVLSGTVVPSNATYKTIVWSIADAGTTGATISSNIIVTKTAGTVTVQATIANGLDIGTPYTQYFPISINSPFTTSPATPGKITIYGIPSTVDVIGIYRNAYPTTLMDLLAINNSGVLAGWLSSSTGMYSDPPVFGLYKGESSIYNPVPWSSTGRFTVFVLLKGSSEIYFISDVDFINGSVAFNFSDMKDASALPLYYISNRRNRSSTEEPLFPSVCDIVRKQFYFSL